MVSSSLKFYSLRETGILEKLFVKFCYMTPSMVGLSKNVSLALEGFFFQALMVFLSNGTATDLFIYSSSAQIDTTVLERKHWIIFVQLC